MLQGVSLHNSCVSKNTLMFLICQISLTLDNQCEKVPKKRFLRNSEASQSLRHFKANLWFAQPVTVLGLRSFSIFFYYRKAIYRVSQKSRTIQVSTENAFINYSHNRCSNCAPTAMKQASNLSIKLSFSLLSVLLLIFRQSSSYCILVIVVI